MKKNHTDIIMVIDRSYSIRTFRMEEATMEGFNGFIADQKKVPGSASLTAVLFADTYEFLHEGIDIQSVPELTTKEYQADGSSTALWDAVGKTIIETGKRIDNMIKADKPEKVIFVIMTDGQENSSKEIRNGNEIRKLIGKKEEEADWQFVFTGANEDPFGESAKMGISNHQTLAFAATAKGTRSAYSDLSAQTVAYRGGIVGSMSFNDDASTGDDGSDD